MKEKRDFGQQLKNLKGQPIRIGATLHAQTIAAVLGVVARAGVEPVETKKITDLLDKEIGAPLTLCDAAISALTAGYDDERNLDGAERLKRFKLALRLKPTMVKIDTEERDLLKKLIGKHFVDNLIAPQCWLLLEGKEVVAEPEDEEQPKLAAV